MKFHKVKTVLKYCKESWKNSLFVIDKIKTNESKSNKCRICIWFDLVYCFVKYGDDFNDYCTFKFWEKTSEERKSYISLRRNDVLRFKMSTPRVYNLFLDKAAFNERFSKFVYRGWMITEGRDIADIDAFVHNYESVIVKPLEDYGGHGVMKLSCGHTDYKDKLEHLATCLKEGKKYIVEQTIGNNEELKHIAPGSLNTVRLVTVIDKNKQLHIIASLLRMGNGTAITDNYHDGGMACPIDLKTFKLRGNAYGMNCVEYSQHPFSKIIFDGYQLHEIDKCVEMVKEIAFMEPEARYVGWDFAITPTGVELLEGNIPPGEDITQISTGCGMWYKMLEWI
ncbi:MAG: hypothetical protein KBT15_10525 [Bacteroidales bacterium]|nr:hypothetical protein [Candidatus Minthousia equi]